RLQKLAALNNVPPSDVEHAANDLTTAQELVRQQEIEIERDLTVTRQQYDDLKEREERCKFVSPLDGIISAVNAADEEFMSETSVPFVLASRETHLEGQINEEDVGHVAAQM